MYDMMKRNAWSLGHAFLLHSEGMKDRERMLRSLGNHALRGGRFIVFNVKKY